MNRTKIFLSNSFSSLIQQIILFASGFIVLKVILTNYGSEVNGFINSITQFVGYFKLVEAGLSGAAIYALYKPLADKDINLRNVILTSSKKLYYRAGFLFLGLMIVFAIIYPLFINLDTYNYWTNVLLILILGISTIIDFFIMAKYRVLLTADQKLYVISIASSVQLLISTGVFVICSAYNVNLLAMYTLSVLTVFIRVIFLKTYVKKMYKNLQFNLQENTKLLAQRWDVLYNQILNVIQNGAPLIIVTVCTQDLKLVSVFAVYSLIIGGINNVLNIFKGGLYTGFGDLLARNEHDKLNRVFNEFETVFHYILVVIITITTVVFIPFIEIYTNGISDIKYADFYLVLLFVLNCYLYNLKVPHGMLIIGAGHYKKTRKAVTIQGLILLVLGFTLTPIYGIYGVLVSSIASNLYRIIEMIIYIPKNIIDIHRLKTTFKYIMYSVFFVINVLSIMFLFDSVDIDSYVSLMIYFCIVSGFTVTYQSILWILFFKNDFKIVFLRIRRVLKN